MTIPGGEPQRKGDDRVTEEIVLTLADGDIHVCQDGPADAPTLLLVHGSASSTHTWDALVPLLTATHRVIRIDLLGHGRSAKPDDADYAIPEQARRVGEALDLLGVERAVVVGHSSGGVAATALATRRPDLVTALVLVDTGPSLDAFIAPPVDLDPTSWPPTEEQVRHFGSSAFGSADFEMPRRLVDDVRGMTFRSLTASMQATHVHLAQQALPDRLVPLGIPLQVIFGDQDRRWRPSSAADYLAVPGARVDMMAGVGHTPIIEDPPRTAELLLAFTRCALSSP